MNPRYLVIAALVVGLPGVGSIVCAQSSVAKGKISRNFYRIPYSSSQSVQMNFDYRDHGNTPAGDFGSMDMASSSSGTRLIVAAAAGTVVGVSDGLNGCGCNSAFSPCANSVTIDHANGERSLYLHIAQNSATSRGITVGTVVAAGTTIGVEGDVGWTCGSGSAPRSANCIPTVPPGTGNCGPHLHWNVRRVDTNERVNPMTCGINNSLYVDGGSYTAAACSTAGCPTNSGFSGTLDSFGEWRVIQADNQVTAGTNLITNMGSLVLHAGNSVRMTPGFHADAGGYVRAEIGPCNTTAVAPIPTPEPTTASPLDENWWLGEGGYLFAIASEPALSATCLVLWHRSSSGGFGKA